MKSLNLKTQVTQLFVSNRRTKKSGTENKNQQMQDDACE